jgi:hypothetical protein
MPQQLFLILVALCPLPRSLRLPTKAAVRHPSPDLNQRFCQRSRPPGRPYAATEGRLAAAQISTAAELIAETLI